MQDLSSRYIRWQLVKYCVTGEVLFKGMIRESVPAFIKKCVKK